MTPDGPEAGKVPPPGIKVPWDAGGGGSGTALWRGGLLRTSSHAGLCEAGLRYDVLSVYIVLRHVFLFSLFVLFLWLTWEVDTQTLVQAGLGPVAPMGAPPPVHGCHGVPPRLQARPLS